MKSIELYLSELARRQNSHTAVSTSGRDTPTSNFLDEVCQSANRGWQIFPESPLAKYSANPNLLICEATSEISRIEELVVEYPLCAWRVAIGPSLLCILQLNGQEGRDSFAQINQDQGECGTLQANLGSTCWAFFQWPKGLALRPAGSKPAPGVRVLGDGESCIIPPSRGCSFTNPWAEVEALPYALRELAFETSDPSPGKIAVEATLPRCRTARQTDVCPAEPPLYIRRRNPVGGQAFCRGKFRLYRQR